VAFTRWEQGDGGNDNHMGLVMLLALLGGLAFGGFVFWQMSGAPLDAISIDFMGAQAESRPPARSLVGATAPEAQTAAQEAQQAQEAQEAQEEERPAAPAEPTVAVQPTSPPQATAAAVVDAVQAHVAHTDGSGVVLRASPRENEWTPRGFMDGAAVTILERQGTDWARIRGPNGQEGWVPTRYLGP
jgi:Bacterial SH3 domain